jgi:hypothetical protein
MLLILAGVALAACAPTGESGPEPVELTEEFGCAYGFYSSNDDQTVGLFLEYGDFDGATSGSVSKSSPIEQAWNGELRFGADLFANWCDDVMEPGEPTPVIDETWAVTGRVDVVELPAAGECGPATANLTDVVATSPEGEEMPLGDLNAHNEFWGCFAG